MTPRTRRITKKQVRETKDRSERAMLENLRLQQEREARPKPTPTTRAERIKNAERKPSTAAPPKWKPADQPSGNMNNPGLGNLSGRLEKMSSTEHRIRSQFAAGEKARKDNALKMWVNDPQHRTASEIYADLETAELEKLIL